MSNIVFVSNGFANTIEHKYQGKENYNLISKVKKTYFQSTEATNT